MEVNKRRTPAITPLQKDILFGFMKVHQELQNPKFSSDFTKAMARELWQRVTLDINSMEVGSSKKWYQVRQCWQDLKKTTQWKNLNVKKTEQHPTFVIESDDKAEEEEIILNIEDANRGSKTITFYQKDDGAEGEEIILNIEDPKNRLMGNTTKADTVEWWSENSNTAEQEELNDSGSPAINYPEYEKEAECNINSKSAEIFSVELKEKPNSKTKISQKRVNTSDEYPPQKRNCPEPINLKNLISKETNREELALKREELQSNRKYREEKLKILKLEQEHRRQYEKEKLLLLRSQISIQSQILETLIEILNKK